MFSCHLCPQSFYTPLDLLKHKHVNHPNLAFEGVRLDKLPNEVYYAPPSDHSHIPSMQNDEEATDDESGDDSLAGDVSEDDFWREFKLKACDAVRSKYNEKKAQYIQRGMTEEEAATKAQNKVMQEARVELKKLFLQFIKLKLASESDEYYEKILLDKENNDAGDYKAEIEKLKLAIEKNFYLFEKLLPDITKCSSECLLH